MRPHENVKGPASRIIPDLIRIQEADDIPFQPAQVVRGRDRCSRILCRRIVRRKEGDPEILQFIFIDQVLEPDGIGKGPVIPLCKVVTDVGPQYDRSDMGDAPVGLLFPRFPVPAVHHQRDGVILDPYVAGGLMPRFVFRQKVSVIPGVTSVC